MQRLAIFLCTALFATASSALAEDAVQTAQSECLKDISSLQERHATTRSHLSEADRRSLKSLRQAARVSVAEDHDGACRAIQDVIAQLLDERRQQLVDKGIALEVDRELRLEQLRKSKAIRDSRAVLRASDLVGAELRNLRDDELGEIEDVIVDGATGDLDYILVATGGFLGIGEDLVAVPIESLRATESLETVVLDMTADEVAAAPVVEGGDLNQVSDSAWREMNDQYFATRLEAGAQ